MRGRVTKTEVARAFPSRPKRARVRARARARTSAARSDSSFIRAISASFSRFCSSLACTWPLISAIVSAYWVRMSACSLTIRSSCSCMRR